MFKTWLVANLDIAYIVASLILICVTAPFLLIPDTEQGIYFIITIAIFLAFFYVPLHISNAESGGPLFLFLVLGGLYYLYIDNIGDNEENVRLSNTIVLTVIAIMHVPAFFVAKYAYENFHDVVSRRWFYRNSSKNVFEVRWKYTFNRFFMALLTMTVFTICVTLVICAIIAFKSGSPEVE